MRAKHLLLITVAFTAFSHSSNAQLLKKIRNKVDQTLNKSDSNTEKTEESSSATENTRSSNAATVAVNDEKKSVRWCDGLEAAGGGSGGGGVATKDGVEYKKIYSGANSFRILYDESSLGISSDSKGYRLVLNEKVNNKDQFTLVENGKVVATDTKVPADWISKTSAGPAAAGDDRINEAMQKYIVGDTAKHEIPKTDAKSVSIQKVDDSQVEMVLQMARQTEDYKKMSAAEKKEFEETLKAGIAQNNSMAGTTMNVPAQEGGTMALVNGYYVVVKGKKYGKFQYPPVLDVSPDETRIFAVGMSEEGGPVMLANGKKTPLDKNKYSAVNGQMVRSPDRKKLVYLEQKRMSDEELEELTKAATSNKRTLLQYNVIKPDGSSMVVTDHNYSGKFRLTNSGVLININEETGEVFADGKSIGKFPVPSGDRLDPESVLIGSDIAQVAYYNGNEGSFTYLDGTVKKLDIVYPRVISEGGKSYLTWFRKCGKEIYLARFAY